MRRLLLLFLFFIGFAAVPAIAQAASVGAQTAYTSTSSGNGIGSAQDYLYSNATTGNVNTLHVHLTSGSTANKAEIGLYAGTTANATTRLADCVISSPTAGAWNTCTVASVALTAGSSYWLAVLLPTGSTGQLVYSEGQVSGGPKTYVTTASNFASLPTTWPSSVTGFTGGYQGSLYADAAAPTNSTVPVVSGTAQQGSTLTTSDGTWTGSPSFTYKWWRCTTGGTTCSQVGSAKSYTLVASDVGFLVHSQVFATNSGGTGNAASAAVGPVQAAPAAVSYTQSCTPSASTVPIGSTLNATGTLKNTGGTSITLPSVILAGRPPGGTNGGGPFDDFSPSGSNVTIAPGQSYTLSASRSFPSGSPTGSWYCFLTYQAPDGSWHDDPQHGTFTVNAAPAGPTAAFAFSPASPQTGQQVTFDGTGSTCNATPCSYRYVNLADSATIGTSQTSSFTFTTADTKQVQLTVTDANGQTNSVEHDVVVTAAPVAPSNTTLPAISGTPQSGSTLTASSGTWSGDTPMTFTYAWSDGATGQTDSLTDADIGQNISVTVTAHNDASTTGQATSQSVGPVTAAPPTNWDPSGQAMPTGDTADWHQVFADNFATDNVPVGGFSGCTQNGSVITSHCSGLPAGVDQNWWAYPDGWASSASDGIYYPSKVLSIQNGVMDAFIHSEVINGTDTHVIAAPLPKDSTATGSFGGRVYGRYQVRMKLDSTQGYHVSFLLWPDSNVWPRDGEIDFPEADFDNGNTSAFLHWQGATSGSQADAYSSNTAMSSGWHTYTIEWTATAVTFKLDGATVGSTTDPTKIPNTPMHWVLQTDRSPSEPVTDANQSHVQVDWVREDTPASTAPAAPTNTAPPTITGTPQQGSTLNSSQGSWTGSPTFGYQWQRCTTTCSDITGATGSTYTLVSADVGDTIKVKVTGTNAGGSATATSASVGPVQAASTTFAGPIFAANTFNSGEADGVPHGIQEIGVSTDGVAISGASWEEYNHDARLYDPSSGKVLGPYTNTRNGPGGGGILGVAVDASHVYYATGNGLVERSSRSAWLDPGNKTWFDNGSQDGTSPLTVDSAGGSLGEMVLCNSQLYVIDGNAVKIVPTSLSGVSSSFTVTGVKALACDRQGDVWALVPGSTSVMRRYTSTGSAVSSFNLPSGVYGTGIAGDPTGDNVWLADNGPDQNFKRYSYTGSQTSSIGVAGGYLADGGKLDASHFAGPVGIAADAAGEIFTAEDGQPGVGSKIWAGMGPSTLITKFNADGSTAWRDFAAEFGGQGQPTADMNTFYDRDFEYKRQANGSYTVPYAFTVDPWANPSDGRVGGTDPQYGMPTWTFDQGGHRYTWTANGSPLTIYEQQTGSEILKPVVTFSQNMSDFWVDDSQNVWGVGTDGKVYKWPLQGWDASGVPQYNQASPTTYPWPAQVSQSLRRIEVHGNNVYVSGFSSSDPNPDSDFDGWKSMGRHLIKFSSLPTASGWPAPAWQADNLYSGSGGTQFPYTVSFAVNDTGQVGVAWIYDPNTNQMKLDVRSDTNGSLTKTLSPPIPGMRVGYDDGSRSIEARGGWIISENDWSTDAWAVCVAASGTCQ